MRAPFLGEVFTAIRGRGAHLNGKPISAVAPQVELSGSIGSTGFPHARRDTRTLGRRVSRLIANCGDIRRTGAPSLDICDVAAGRSDAHTETLAPWDVAAAGLIAREAGVRVGQVTDRPGDSSRDLDGDNFLAARLHIFAELQQLLVDR